MRRSGSLVKQLISSRWLRSAAHNSPGIRELSSAYVAGGLITDAVFVAAKLRRQGLDVGFAWLPMAEETRDFTTIMLDLLHALGDNAAGVELSVRPSRLGLRDDFGRAKRDLARLCEAAEAVGAFVTLESERPEDHEKGLALYRAMAADCLAITLPVNLRRSEQDCQELATAGARVRLCIGSYPLSSELGWQRETDKAKALVRCIRVALEVGGYPMVATHDPQVIEITQELAHRLGRTDYEFQLLYGVRPLEQRRLVDIGLKCRTYVPFGPGWYEYFSRRVAARPRILGSYLRALLDKR